MLHRGPGLRPSEATGARHLELTMALLRARGSDTYGTQQTPMALGSKRGRICSYASFAYNVEDDVCAAITIAAYRGRD